MRKESTSTHARALTHVRARGATAPGSEGDTLGFYDVPALYDVLYSVDTAREVRGLQRIEARFVPRRRGVGVWLEPACGTGRYLRLALRRGKRVIGFDTNERMLAYAARRLRSKRALLFRADMTEFLAGLGNWRADFAFNTFNTIRHLQCDADVLAHLAQMARALRPGGIYAVGLGMAAYGVDGPSEDVWSARRGRLEVRQVAQNLPPTAARGNLARRELIVSHVTAARPNSARHFDFVYPLRTYSRDQWERLIAASAMELIGETDERGRDLLIVGYGMFILRARA